ncbi:MAG: threonylcarbamoyl-AMP synthase [Bacteroidales bacterium]|nr:threonylcarbamoyl-AMP synthase [Bacteroidales bacterium]
MNHEIERALEILQDGGTILYPTDTIWGLGCDASDPEAVGKIIRIKKRDDRKSMLVLIDDAARLSSYVEEIPGMAFTLIQITDKPLTIIYPGAKNLAANLIAEDGSAGIRITPDPFCRTLIKKLGRPLVSTSANLSGEPAPSAFSEISGQIRQQVDYVVDWRRDESFRTAPSSIIKFDRKGVITIIRR